MQATIKVSERKALIRLSGRFEFSEHRVFKDILDEALQSKDVDEVVVDLAAVEYLDSSALGMLLMFRDKAKSHSKRSSLANPSAAAKQILDIAHFEKIFPIVYGAGSI